MANKLYNKQVSPKGYQTGGRVAKMGGGMMMKRPMMNGSRTNMKIGGLLKKVGKKVGKAAAGVGAAVLAAKALKKKKPTGKKQDAVDKFFKKKGTTLKTGSAIAAETMAKADRDKKIFRKGLDKIAAAGGTWIRNGAGEFNIKCNSNASTDIYYANAVKFATTSTGASITGLMSATTIDGAAGDNLSLDFGSIA